MLILKLSQGDTDEKEVILKHKNLPADLTGAQVSMIMKNNLKTVRIVVPCEIQNPPTSGKVKIKFSSTHTEKDGVFSGEFPVIIEGIQNIFPSAEEDRLIIIIKKKL